MNYVIIVQLIIFFRCAESVFVFMTFLFTKIHFTDSFWKIDLKYFLLALFFCLWSRFQYLILFP